MSDVIELDGICEAVQCKRGERTIRAEADRVVVREKTYHLGCEPTPDEIAAFDRSSGTLG